MNFLKNSIFVSFISFSSIIVLTNIWLQDRRDDRNLNQSLKLEKAEVLHTKVQQSQKILNNLNNEVNYTNNFLKSTESNLTTQKDIKKIAKKHVQENIAKILQMDKKIIKKYQELLKNKKNGKIFGKKLEKLEKTLKEIQKIKSHNGMEEKYKKILDDYRNSKKPLFEKIKKINQQLNLFIKLQRKSKTNLNNANKKILKVIPNTMKLEKLAKEIKEELIILKNKQETAYQELKIDTQAISDFYSTQK